MDVISYGHHMSDGGATAGVCASWARQLTLGGAGANGGNATTIRVAGAV